MEVRLRSEFGRYNDESLLNTGFSKDQKDIKTSGELEIVHNFKERSKWPQKGNRMFQIYNQSGEWETALMLKAKQLTEVKLTRSLYLRKWGYQEEKSSLLHSG